MSSEVLLTSVARVETDESGHGGAEPQLLPPLEFDTYNRLSEPSDEELDAVLSGEKSHDGGDHADADTQHRIEHLEPFFRLCACFGLHAAATAPLKPWQKAHGIVIVILMGVCGIRAALAVRQLMDFSSLASLDIFVAVFFLGSIPAFMLKLRIFWSRPQLHRSFSLLLDPAHDALMHSSRIEFSKRARSIWSHKLFYFYLLCQISSCIWACYAYFSYWSVFVEITGAVGIYASLILEAIIIPYVAQCIICEVIFVQFVCDSHVCAIRRLEALFVSSRLAQSLEDDLMDFKSDRTLDTMDSQPGRGSLLQFGLEAIRRNRVQLFNSCTVLFWPVVAAVIAQLTLLACALALLGYQIFFAAPARPDGLSVRISAIFFAIIVCVLFLSFVYRMARVSSACEQCVTSLMLRGAYRFSDPVERQRLNWLVNETLATRDADFFTVSGSRVSMTAWLQVASLLGTVIAAALTKTFGFK